MQTNKPNTNAQAQSKGFWFLVVGFAFRFDFGHGFRLILLGLWSFEHVEWSEHTVVLMIERLLLSHDLGSVGWPLRLILILWTVSEKKCFNQSIFANLNMRGFVEFRHGTTTERHMHIRAFDNFENVLFRKSTSHKTTPGFVATKRQQINHQTRSINSNTSCSKWSATKRWSKMNNQHEHKNVPARDKACMKIDSMK